MKWFGDKKMLLIICSIILVMLGYVICTSFIYSANLGYLVGDILNNVDVPTDETYINTFSETQVDWEIAYWSAMICEYTYEKHGYLLDNRALEKLGFTTIRKYSFYEFEGEFEDDLMVDVGMKEVHLDDDNGFTLVAVAFRGSVPVALNDPTSKENMRRNMKHSPKPWKEIEAFGHGGFYDQYSDFLNDILPEINKNLNLSMLQNESASNKNIKFWVAGHSMGGALAELFTLDLIESGVEPEKIITYGFATPLVGDNRLFEYAKSIGVSDRIYKIVHKQDMIGCIGYGISSGKSLATNSNIVKFGKGGIFDRSHHSLPRVYLPFVISQNSQSKRQQFEASLVIADM